MFRACPNGWRWKKQKRFVRTKSNVLVVVVFTCAGIRKRGENNNKKYTERSSVVAVRATAWASALNAAARTPERSLRGRFSRPKPLFAPRTLRFYLVKKLKFKKFGKKKHSESKHNNADFKLSKFREHDSTRNSDCTIASSNIPNTVCVLSTSETHDVGVISPAI